MANFLGDLALVRTENVAENAAGVGLTRRWSSCLLAAKDHAREAAEIIENAAAAVVLFEGVVQLRKDGCEIAGGTSGIVERASSRVGFDPGPDRLGNDFIMPRSERRGCVQFQGGEKP